MEGVLSKRRREFCPEGGCPYTCIFGSFEMSHHSFVSRLFCKVNDARGCVGLVIYVRTRQNFVKNAQVRV